MKVLHTQKVMNTRLTLGEGRVRWLSISTDTNCRGLPDRVLDVRCAIGRSITCSLVERRRIDPPHVPLRHALDTALLKTPKKPESGAHPPAFGSASEPPLLSKREEPAC